MIRAYLMAGGAVVLVAFAGWVWWLQSSRNALIEENARLHQTIVVERALKEANERARDHWRRVAQQEADDAVRYREIRDWVAGEDDGPVPDLIRDVLDRLRDP
jgi:hypothetical protein